MNGTPKLLYTLYVPLTQNDGQLQPLERLEWVEEEIVKRAGGLTRYAPGEGLWVSSVTTPLCRDEVIPFHVVTADGPETEAWLTELVADIARVFEQQEVFVFAQTVWLVEAEPVTA